MHLVFPFLGRFTGVLLAVSLACSAPTSSPADNLTGRPSASLAGTLGSPQSNSGNTSVASVSLSAAVTPSAASSSLAAPSARPAVSVILMPALSFSAPAVVSALATVSAPAHGASATSVSMPPLGATGSATHGSSTSGVPSATARPSEVTPSTVFLAGDSTVSTYKDTGSPSDQAGWGQMLHEHLDPPIVVENRAVGGRTARRFIDEGYLEKIDAELAAGDTLLVQFGTNDGNKTATYTLNGEEIPYYLDPATDFKKYLTKYIDVALAHRATPVLVTPPPRNSAYCTGGNGTGAHAQAMRELGKEHAVAVVDLNDKAVAYLKAICPAPAVEDFFLVRSDGTVDGTHFQEHGARVLAGFVADGLVAAGVPLANAVK